MNVKYILKVLCLLFAVVSIFCNITQGKEKKSYYPITPVSFTDITLTDDFWSGRIGVRAKWRFGYRESLINSKFVSSLEILS